MIGGGGGGRTRLGRIKLAFPGLDGLSYGTTLFGISESLTEQTLVQSNPANFTFDGTSDGVDPLVARVLVI